MICKQVDTFFDNARFIVEITLSNNETIYLDDGRDGVQPSSAWLRLKQYCETNKLRIRDVIAICDKGKIPLIENAEDKRLFAIGRVSWFNGISIDMFNLGVVEGDTIKVASYAKYPFGLVEVTFRPTQGNEWLII